MTEWSGQEHFDPTTGALIVDIGDNGTKDAFGRIRVSNPETILDEKNVSVSPVLFNQAGGTGSATRQVQRSSFYLNSGTTTDSYALRQTRQRAPYQPGKSQQIQVTFVGYELAAGITARIGYFDDKNGLFLEANGTDLRFVIRSDTTGSVVDTYIEREDWADPLDGTGPSGWTLDFTKAQILNMDFQWLGVGRTRFGFVIDGKVIDCADNLWSNRQAVVYMRNPNLPIRWEIRNTANASEKTLEAICGKVAAEGGFNKRGISLGFDTGATTRSLGATEEELLSCRLTSAAGEIIVGFLEKIEAFNTSNAAFIWRLRVNPTGPAGGSWVTPSASGIEYNVTRTGTVTGGVVLDSGYSNGRADRATSPLFTLFGLGYDVFTSAYDIFSLTVQNITGPADPYLGALTFRQEG